MILSLDYSSAHRFGDVLPAQFKLRHQEFVQRQNYDVSTIEGMEYDAYDTPATAYLIARDAEGNVLGVSRKNPTNRSYMIKDLWPYLVTDIEMPESHLIWESSRFCVNSRLDPETRLQVKAKLVCAGLEFGLLNNISFMIGVMPPAIWRAVFINCGWPVEHIGPVTRFSTGEKVVAAKMPVKREYLENVREKMHLDREILKTSGIYIGSEFDRQEYARAA